MLSSHADEQSIANICKPQCLQKFGKIERHQTLIQGVTMMYLMFKVCRKSILITTATMLRNMNKVRPNRAAPQRNKNSSPIVGSTNQYINAVPTTQYSSLNEIPRIACIHSSR